MEKKIVSNVGAERAVLAGICQYNKEAYFDICDIIGINSFSLESNQAFWKCLEHLINSTDKIDATSIIATAETLGLTSIVAKSETDIVFIRSLFNFPIHLTNVRKMAKQIAKLEFIRKAQKALLESYQELQNFDGTEAIDKIIAVPEKAIFELTNDLNSRGENNPILLGHGTLARLKHLSENPVKMIGLPTPWPLYNELIGGGLRPGVHLVGARPKTGKSTFALNVALHLAPKPMNIPILYIDTEMAKDEQENRAIAVLSNINNRLIETGQFKIEQLKDSITKLEGLPIYHHWVGGKPFEEILSVIRRWLFSTVKFDNNGNINPHLVIYDYFKLMSADGLKKMQEYQAIGFQISGLSDFCKQYKTPCLSFVQLNRDGITKETSDIIGQSDRLLWLAVSCCIFKPKEEEEVVEDGRENGNRKLLAPGLGCRFGEPLQFGDYINMNFDGKTSTITELRTKFQSKNNNQNFEVLDLSDELSLADV